jgi:hypothetical protein
MNTLYICSICDFYKKKGCLDQDSKFYCSDCDRTYWKEKRKWSKNGFIYQK